MSKNERNVAFNPMDALAISRIIQCAAEACTRTIVEYNDGSPATKHSGGVPAESVRVARERHQAVVQRACDHHGGYDYESLAIKF